MNPIISPWLFYLAELSNNLLSLCGGGLICSVAFIAFSPIIRGILDLSDEISDLSNSEIIEEEKGVNCEKYLFFKTLCKVSVIVCIICSIGVAFLPSEKTIYKMIIADNVTPNNIEMVEDGAKGVVDYIVETVDRLIKDDDKEGRD